MARSVILSNGGLMVGLNELGLVHDFYYPYVGLENLTTSRSVHHKIGVWVDGIFSWVDSEGWSIKTNFNKDSLISDILMSNQRLGVEMRFSDFVSVEHDSFCRRINVRNLSDSAREVRLFMHQIFEISKGGRADTVLYVPEEPYLFDYKGRYSLLIYAESEGRPFDQFATGNYGIEGKTGTYFDAEDGELSGNAVEHGGVDSVLRVSISLQSGSSKNIDYWIVAASSQQDAEKIHLRIKKNGLSDEIERTERFWQEWLAPAKQRLSVHDEKYTELCLKSLMIIKAHIDRRGGIIASGDSSIYNYGRDYYSYVWPRDGAYAFWPLVRLGYKEEVKKFLIFCRDVLHESGYLMHKYQPDRAVGSTWHPLVHGKRKELAIQEDETASIIFLVGEYLNYSNDHDFVLSIYDSLIKPAADFMTEYFDTITDLPHASYDLWEEKFLTNTYTVCVTHRALKVASIIADNFDYRQDSRAWLAASDRIARNVKKLFSQEAQSYVKGYLLTENGEMQYDETIDISNLYGPMMYLDGGVESAAVAQTAAAIEKKLTNQSPIGGVIRYEHDGYFLRKSQYKGNPWIVCTLWLAQYYSAVGATDNASQLLEWVVSRTGESGVMSEQVDPEDGGMCGVAPLVWSHAEFVNTLLDIEMHSKDE